MDKERISVVFSDDSINIDGALKRIPLKPPPGSGATAVAWDPVSQSGKIIFDNGTSESFTDPAFVAPFLEAWKLEPEQPDAPALGAYLDTMKTRLHDENITFLKSKWAAVKRRHLHKVGSEALLQYLTEKQGVAKIANHEAREAKAQLFEQLVRNQHEREADRAHADGNLEKAEAKPANVFKIREAERKRLREQALKKPNRT